MIILEKEQKFSKTYDDFNKKKVTNKIETSSIKIVHQKFMAIKRKGERVLRNTCQKNFDRRYAKS